VSVDILGPPQERGSVRPVTLDSDPGKAFYCEVRAASPRTGLQVGAVVYVNFGTPNNVEGQWYRCQVLPSPDGVNTASGVHVRRLADG